MTDAKMKPFDGDSVCAKCGHRDVRALYKGPIGLDPCCFEREERKLPKSEYIHRTCARCGFQWPEAVIAEAKEPLAAPEKELAAVSAKPATKRWKPTVGKRYWAESGSVIYSLVWSDDDEDAKFYAMGNVYPSKKAAMRARDRQLLLVEMRDFADFTPGWNNSRQDKWALFYDYCDEAWKTAVYFRASGFFGLPVFPSEERALEAIEHFGPHLDLLLE